MPPTFFRIAIPAVLVLLLSISSAKAQSGNDPCSCSTGQASSCHTVSFRFGDYDIISSIYVFLTSGNQQRTYKLEIVSIQRRSGLGLSLPTPIALDQLFRAAINAHHQEGDIPCNESGEEVPLQAILSNTDGLSSALFTLSSQSHLSDQWVYSIECGDEEIRILFSEFLEELLFD